MNPLEQLAVITALEKLIKDRKAELKAECNQEFLEQYKEIGIKKKELRLDSQKVGEYLIPMAKPEFVISNKEQFDDFALTYGLATIKKSIDPWMVDKAIAILEENLSPEDQQQYIHEEVVYDPNWQKAMGWIDGQIALDGTPLLVPGVEYQPETPKTPQVRGCDPEDVLPVVKRIGGFDQLLLGGADE